MRDCKITRLNDDSVQIEIFVKRKSMSAIYFAGFLGIMFFVLPISIMIALSADIGFGSMLVCLFTWIIAWYFVRLFLWNKYGKEVFAISQNELIHYNDYRLYKDNYTSYQYTKYEVLYFVDNIGFSISGKASIVDDDSFLGFDIDGKIIISNKKIALNDILEISLAIEFDRLSKNNANRKFSSIVNNN